MNDVVPVEIKWLWQDRLPLWMMAILDGDPSLGKSTIALDLAARVSRGQPMPFAHRALSAANVLLLLAEDHLGGTVRPRLDAAGADCQRVFVFDSVSDDYGKRPVTLPDDFHLLRQKIKEYQARLLVVDPLMAFLGPGVDAHKDQSIRTLLYQLKVVIEELNCTSLVLRHLNKNEGGNPLYRGGGSIGIIGAARCGLLAGKAPDKPDTFLLAATKNNCGPLARCLRYRIEADGCVGRIHWMEETDHVAQDLLAKPARSAEKLEEAETFLKKTLAQGSLPPDEVYRRAKALGLKVHTVDRAKKELLVQSKKTGLTEGWEWSLPSEGRHDSGDGGNVAPFEGRHDDLAPFEGRTLPNPPGEMAPFGKPPDYRTPFDEGPA
jgi:hypothetical protein